MLNQSIAGFTVCSVARLRLMLCHFLLICCLAMRLLVNCSCIPLSGPHVTFVVYSCRLPSWFTVQYWLSLSASVYISAVALHYCDLLSGCVCISTETVASTESFVFDTETQSSRCLISFSRRLVLHVIPGSTTCKPKLVSGWSAYSSAFPSFLLLFQPLLCPWSGVLECNLRKFLGNSALLQVSFNKFFRHLKLIVINISW